MNKPPEEQIQKGLEALKSLEPVAEKAMDPEKKADEKDEDEELEKALTKYEEDCEKAMPDNLKAYVAKKRSKTDKAEAMKAMPTVPDYQAIAEKTVEQFGEVIVSRLREATEAQFAELTKGQTGGMELVSKALGAFEQAANNAVALQETVKSLQAEIKALKDSEAPRISIAQGAAVSKGIEASQPVKKQRVDVDALVRWSSSNLGDPFERINFIDTVQAGEIEKAMRVYAVPEKVLVEAGVQL